MSEIGKTCMWTVKPAPQFGAWCGAPGAFVVTVPPLPLADRVVKGYALTLCARHHDAWQQGVRPDDVAPKGSHG